MYSEKVKGLLKRLPNRGVCKNPTYKGRSENPVCGDITEVQLRVDGGKVVECRFQAYGCPGTVAAAAGLTELVDGENLESCRRVSVGTLLDSIGGLPAHKEHGAELAVAALQQALKSAPS